MKTKVFKIINIVLLVAAVIAMIVGLVIVSSDDKKAAEAAEKETFSSEYISIAATGKTESVSGSRYVSKITFNVRNDSIHTVQRIQGEMKFYDGDTEFGSGNIFFERDIAPSSSETITITFEGSSNVYRRIYEIPYEDLGITYKITSIVFEKADASRIEWTYNNAAVKWLKTAASGS